VRVFEEHGLKSRNEIFFVLAAAAIIMFIRKTDGFINPQFWAEDGNVVFLQQYKQGFTALFNVHAGYLLLVPRIVGLISDLFFPYWAAPYVYNYSCIVITILVIANVYSPRFNYEPKPLLALTMVMVPYFGYEVGTSLVNVQWVLCILLVTNYLKEAPSEKYGNVSIQVASDLIQLVLVGLTGPFIIFMTPFYLWRFLKEKNWYWFSILCSAAVVSSVQAACILTSKLDLVSAGSGEWPKWTDLLEIVGVRLFGNLFLARSITKRIYAYDAYILFCLFVPVIVLIFYKVGRMTKNVHAVIVFIGLSFLILISALLKGRANLGIFMDVGGGANSRYFYPLYVLITWSLLLCLSKGRKWTDYTIKVMLIAICISSFFNHFHVRPMIDYKWSEYSKLIGKNDQLIIPINPPNWQIKMK